MSRMNAFSEHTSGRMLYRNPTMSCTQNILIRFCTKRLFNIINMSAKKFNSDRTRKTKLALSQLCRDSVDSSRPFIFFLYFTTPSYMQRDTNARQDSQV